MKNRKKYFPRKALWSLFWRAVLFFPITLAILLGAICCFGWLLDNAVQCLVAERWPLTALYSFGIASLIFLVRAIYHWLTRGASKEPETKGTPWL